MPSPRARAGEKTGGHEARMVALDALVGCLEERRPLERALEDESRFAALPARDRARVWAVTAETCRRLGQIDALVAACLDHPLPGRARRARAILRAGVAELLFLGTAPHAAVSGAVALAQRRAHGHAPLVNAVLRRLARQGAAMVAGQDGPRLNAPDWLYRSWHAAFGAGKARAIAEAHGHRPGLDITVKGAAAGWARRLDARPLPTGGLRLAPPRAVAELPGFTAGAWWVQDAAAALPARLLGQVAGKRVLDMCAAPGGKTAQLAAAGAAVTALDRSSQRLARLAANMDRLGLDVEMVEADATDWRPAMPFDACLLDAPCSGTGAIRRHPDIAWTKRPDDPARLARLQAAMIANAAACLKPGGVLVYAVCSLQPEEGEAQAGRAPGDGWCHDPVAAGELGEAAFAIDGRGCLRTLPCHMAAEGGMDGFFAMRLRRAG